MVLVAVVWTRTSPFTVIANKALPVTSAKLVSIICVKES